MYLTRFSELAHKNSKTFISFLAHFLNFIIIYSLKASIFILSLRNEPHVLNRIRLLIPSGVMGRKASVHAGYHCMCKELTKVVVATQIHVFSSDFVENEIMT